MKDIENQKYIISRFDHYYDSVNNKGNFLITFQSFLIGAVILGNRKLDDLVDDNAWQFVFNGLAIIITILALWAIYFLLRAILPYTKSGSTVSNAYKSVIFFNSIESFADQAAYDTNIKNISDVDFSKDLSYQTYNLACGLATKFRKLNVAINFMYWELGVLLLMILIIIVK